MIQEKKETINRAVAFIGFITFVIANILYDYTTTFDAFYYEAQAFAFVCYSYVVARSIGFLGRMVFWVCVSQLFDELFGNPLEPNVWEWIGFVGFFVYEIVNYKKWLNFLRQ